jgi:hypothetical protein
MRYEDVKGSCSGGMQERPKESNHLHGQVVQCGHRDCFRGISSSEIKRIVLL